MDPIKRILLSKAGVEVEFDAIRKRALLLAIIFEAQFKKINEMVAENWANIDEMPELFDFILKMTRGEATRSYWDTRDRTYIDHQEAMKYISEYQQKHGWRYPIYNTQQEKTHFAYNGGEFLEFYELCYYFLFSLDFAEHDYSPRKHLHTFFKEKNISDLMMIDFR